MWLENLEAQLIGVDLEVQLIGENLKAQLIQSIKKFSVIIYNLRFYDRYLIFYGLNKFDVKIEVISNRLEK